MRNLATGLYIVAFAAVVYGMATANWLIVFVGLAWLLGCVVGEATGREEKR